MSKRPNIRWRKSDAEKIDNLVKRFNKKVYNTRHRNADLKNILPDTISQADKQQKIEELKNLPRNEFNKYVNSLERALRPDAFKEVKAKTGNRVTNWEKREVGIKVAQINRARAKERKALEEMDVTTRGMPTGLKRGEMGSERMNALKPKTFNFDKIRGGKEWDKYVEGVDRLIDPSLKDKRLELYKSNYLDAMRTAFGGYEGELYDIVEGLPAELILEKFYTEQEATIDFYYEPQEMMLKLNILTDLWTNIADDYNKGR